MKFLCAHCANGSMRIVAVDGSAVRIECLRCGQESLLEMAPTMPGSADDDPGGRGERQADGQDPEVHAVGIDDGIGDVTQAAPTTGPTPPLGRQKKCGRLRIRSARSQGARNGVQIERSWFGRQLRFLPPLECRHSVPAASRAARNDIRMGNRPHWRRGEIAQGLPGRLGAWKRQIQQLEFAVVPMAPVFLRRLLSVTLEKYFLSAELEKRGKGAFTDLVAVSPSMNGNANDTPVSRFIANTWSRICTPPAFLSPDESAPNGACTGSFEPTTSSGR